MSLVTYFRLPLSITVPTAILLRYIVDFKNFLYDFLYQTIINILYNTIVTELVNIYFCLKSSAIFNIDFKSLITLSAVSSVLQDHDSEK